jgi:hypothetical protein
MYIKTHPYFLEESEIALAQSEVLAKNAQLESLLLEFEHSEEYRRCSKGYLQTPRLILEDFVAETGLPLESLDSEFLLHELFVVIPSRMIDLVEQDAHQILREQLCFWAFAQAQWQLAYAEACLEVLNDSILQKLIKIISLGREKQSKRASISPELHAHQPSLPLDFEFNLQWDQDVYPLNQHIPF